MSSAAVGAGFVLSGRYRLVEPLASGGMGTVWRALDLLLDRPVAVKEVRLPPGLDDGARQLLRRRTIREAQVAARLRHPAVVTIFDVVEQDGRPWIVMELVPSRSLAEIIRADGPLPPVRVAGIGLRVLDAMVAAAAAGVEHRDIKPANVLVTGQGQVVLTDFGIARHVGDETLTSAGLIVGSPDYLAPERARGRAGGLAADLWSLGATMYEAVEGRRPFERNGPLPTLAAVVMDEPEPPQRAGPLRPVIDGLLVKEPAHRLDADRTRSMLQRILRGRPAGGTVPLPRRPPDDAPTAPEPEPPTVIQLDPTRPMDATPDPSAVGGAAGLALDDGTTAQEAGERTVETAHGWADVPTGAAPDPDTAVPAPAEGRAHIPTGTASDPDTAVPEPAGGRAHIPTGTAPDPDTAVPEPADAPTAGRSRTQGALPGTPAAGRRRRRVLLVGLIVLVLAGLAAVLVPALRDDPRDGAAGPAGQPTGPAGQPTGPATSASASGPTASTTPSAPRTTAPGTPAPTRTPTSSNAPATGAEVAAPAGFTRYTDPLDGFSLVVPAGWSPTRSKSIVDFDDPTSSRFLRIDTSDKALPDPYQNWIDYERDFRQGKPDYRRITIRRVPDYRPDEGWTTADWEFMLGRTHVLDRNIRVSSGRAHAIYWSTPQSQWDTAESRRILGLAEQSFVPAPAGR